MRTLIITTLIVMPSIAAAAFRCVDEKGSTHFEETPPAACANVPIVEVGRSGATLRTIAPSAPPPAPVRKPTADEDKAASQADRSTRDAQRRDRALLDSYTSEREIDAARDRNIDIIHGRINAGQLRLKQVSQRERDLDRAVQSLKGRAGPSTRSVQDLQAVRDEKRSIEASIDRLGDDLDNTRRRFEADKARWIELKEKR